MTVLLRIGGDETERFQRTERQDSVKAQSPKYAARRLGSYVKNQGETHQGESERGKPQRNQRCGDKEQDGSKGATPSHAHCKRAEVCLVGLLEDVALKEPECHVHADKDACIERHGNRGQMCSGNTCRRKRHQRYRKQMQEIDPYETR